MSDPMTNTPDIEAVLRELTAEVRYSKPLNGPETHLKSLHRRALATITDLQARVAGAESDLAAHKAAVDEAVRWLQWAPLERSVCCCGNPVKGHGYSDGHSPVDILAYFAGQLENTLRELAEPAKQPEGDPLAEAIGEALSQNLDMGDQEVADALRKALAARGLSVKGEG